MKRMISLAVVAACAAGGALKGDDLAWRFDTSGRPADVKSASASAANADAWELQPGRSAASSTIPLFSSCWRYDAESGGWSYAYVEGFYLIFH